MGVWVARAESTPRRSESWSCPSDVKKRDGEGRFVFTTSLVRRATATFLICDYNPHHAISREQIASQAEVNVGHFIEKRHKLSYLGTTTNYKKDASMYGIAKLRECEIWASST